MKKCLRLHFQASELYELLLYLIYDSLECLGIVYCEVSEDLTVDFDSFLVQQTDEYRI